MQRIGLVLSGGLAKGAYQLGVLKALQAHVDSDSIVAISASSVGVLNAYAYLNQKLDTAEHLWRSLNCRSMTEFVRCILKSDFLERKIAELSATVPFIRKTFYATFLNTTDKDVNYINLKETDPDIVRRFIRASVALPPFNKPIRIKKNSYLDGVLVDNIPIAPMKNESLDCIICIYFDDYNYNFENNDINDKTIKINQQSNMFMKNVFLFRQEYIDRMIEDGYIYGTSVLEKFFENGVLMDDYKNKIHAFNQSNSNLEWYVTCEVLTKRLNQATQKYLNRKKSK